VLHPSVDTHLTTDPQARPAARETTPARAGRLLLLADFGPRPALLPRRVDADNWESTLAAWAPDLSIEGHSWRPESLDDFHPDELARLVPEQAPAPAPALNGLSVLVQMLGSKLDPRPAPPPAPADPLAEAIRRIGREHAQPAPPPGLAQARSARAARVASLLGDASLLKLEAGWRAVRFLLERLGSDEDSPQLFLANFSAEAWSADLNSQPDLAKTAFYKAVTSDPLETFPPEPWSAVVALFDVEPSPATLLALSRAGSIASAGRTCFVASTTHSWMDVDPRLKPAWDYLRVSLEADRLGLVAPRLLLRPGYGPDQLQADVFEGESVNTPPLWAPGALAFAAPEGEIGALPVTSMQPPVSEVFTVSEAEARLEAGLMPLIWWKGTDRTRILRRQSLGSNPVSLA
jgi:hypothetical protein